MKFSEKYRNWLLGLKNESESPGERKDLDSIWARVEEELILDETWSEIESGLVAETIQIPEKRGFFNQKRNMAYRVGGSVLLFSGLISLIIYLINPFAGDSIIMDEDVNPSPQMQDVDESKDLTRENRNRKSTNAETGPVDILNDESGKFQKDKLSEAKQKFPAAPDKSEKSGEVTNDLNIQKEILSEDQMPANPVFERKEGIDQKVDDNIAIQKEKQTAESIENIRKISLHIPDLELPELFMSYTFPRVEIHGRPVNNSTLPRWRFYGGGISVSYNNSWIINDQTLAGLDPANLSDTRISYAPEIGLSAVFASRKGQRFELEYFFISEQNQRFNEYINALYQERKISLHYQKIHASWLFPLNNLPLRAGLGAYYSLLNRAEEIIGGQSNSISDLYTRDDYGVSVQLAMEYKLFSGFVAVPSLRFQYSLKNIFEGNELIPGALRKTSNASAGLNLGILYRF